VAAQHHDSGETARALHSALRTYHRSPLVIAKEIRGLLEDDKEGFYPHAFRTIRAFDGSPGTRYLARLMLERGLMLRALCEPAMPEQRVRGVIEALIQEDPGNDLVLAKAVVDQAQGQQPTTLRKALTRILNQLERLTDARRIAPRLLPLLRHADPQLRSKAVRMMGSCSKNTQWVARQLADPDVRTRANAIEALWGLTDSESRELLRSSIHDPNNRIVGNVLLGLYRAGESCAIKELMQLVSHHAALFRSSAAWAMGECRDARFKDALKTLSADPELFVRTRAAASLQLVEAEAAKAESGVLWRMRALNEPVDCEISERQIAVTVQETDGDERTHLQPTQFCIYEDDRLVFDYSVNEVEPPGKVAMALLLPALGDEAEFPVVSELQRLLEWKRFQDSWATLHFKPPREWKLSATLIGEVIGIPRAPEAPIPVEYPVFTHDRHRAAQALQERPEPAKCAGLWATVLETYAACASMRSPEVWPCLTIYIVNDPGRPAEVQMELLAKVEFTIPIHCIAKESSPFLEELCARSKGEYFVVGDDTEAVDVLERRYIRQVARYKVSYRGGIHAAAGSIEVHDGEGWARAAIQYKESRASSHRWDE
jgi:hypothetical protein